MLLPAFLLSEFKLTLLFLVTLLFGELTALCLVLLLHQFQRLLRLGADAGAGKFFSCIALSPLRIVGSMLRFHFDSRTELQLTVMLHDEFQDLAVLRLGTEGDLCG